MGVLRAVWRLETYALKPCIVFKHNALRPENRLTGDRVESCQFSKNFPFRVGRTRIWNTLPGLLLLALPSKSVRVRHKTRH